MSENKNLNVIRTKICRYIAITFQVTPTNTPIMYRDTLLSSLSNNWKTVLKDEINASYFSKLMNRIEIASSKSTVLPPTGEILNAYKYTDIEDIKVVIIGQDPYHGLGQAHGLSFSVKQGVRQPPSLVNICKELATDVNISTPDKFMGDLTSWAKQGVFLLNTVLTVKESTPNSHKNFGWEKFTDATIKAISTTRKNVVFFLWGNFAKQKAELIDGSKHHIIMSPHPSPFSARRGFFGSRPFSLTNNYLIQTSQTPIDWTIKQPY